MTRSVVQARRITMKAVAATAAVAALAAVSVGAQAATAPPARAADVYVAPSFGDVVVASAGANLVYHFAHYTPIGGVGDLPPVIQTIGTGLNRPSSAAVTRSGHVFIADTGNARVLDVAPDGTQTAYTFGFVTPRSVAVDGAGNAFVADPGSKKVTKITPTGTQTVIARGDTNPNDGFDKPWEVAADAAGNAYIIGKRTSGSIDLVLKVTPAGVKTTLYQVSLFLDGIAVNRAGDVYITEQQSNVKKIPADGSAVTTVFTIPSGGHPVVHLAMNADGNLLSSDELNPAGVRLIQVNRTPATSLVWLNDGGPSIPMGMGIDEWVPAFPASPPPAPDSVVGASYSYTAGFPTLPSSASFANRIGVQSGELPPGLRLVSRTGGFALSGTPTATGTFTFTPEVHNAIDQQVGSPITVTVVDPTAPAAPAIGTATPGNGTAKVAWTAPTSTGGRAITGYVVTPYVGGVAKPAKAFASTATTQTITGLQNGTTYAFTVAATNAIGTGDPSAPSNAVMPQGSWYLRNANSGGTSIGGIGYGSPGDIPVTGDWDGNGTTTIGVYRPSTSTWYLRNANSGGTSIGGFGYGAPADAPLTGDWDGDGTTTIGVYR